jgi:sigma-E factor negative regulatory protein RseB
MSSVARKTGWVGLPAIAIGIACSGVHAAPANDPLTWLQRAANAARSTTYVGTFVHTNGDRTSTYRVTHVSTGGEEHERIEPLDGPPHEIVRRNDEMFCRFPDAKTVRLDRRITAPYFPSIVRAPAESISASYEVKLGKTERILGLECQWLRLQPRDGLRFEHRLCAELASGLVLRAKTINADRQVVEQYTFTDLKVGPQAARGGDVRSGIDAQVRQWRERSTRDEASAADTGWTVSSVPAGFQKITELRRAMPGRTQPVSQIVLSDGLANLSVFVEPSPGPQRSAESASEDGTTTFFVRPMGEHVVTVLGDVPLATAQLVARGVTRR